MIDVNDVKSISELLGQVTEGFSHFFNNMETTLEKLAGIPTLLNGSNDSLNKTTESAKNASEALDKTHGISLNLIDSIEKYGKESLNVFSAITSGNRDQVDNLGNVNDGIMDIISSITLMSLGAPKAFDQFNQSAKGVSSDIATTFLPTFDGLMNTLARTTEFPLLDQMKKFVDVGIPAIDAVNNLENSLLALHGASGDLSLIFQQTGADENNLTKLTDEFNNSIKMVADNTGASIPSIMGYTAEVLKIPGLYQNIINTNLSGNIGYVEAAMKVARGTTQNFADVIGIVNAQFENMNKKGQGPLELMSRMYGVSQSLGIPFSYISDQVKTVSEQFKFFGDNTQGALNIVEGLGPKLMESGLGPKAVQELIGGVITTIKDLDVAQKSLLSSKTGGAGGLQGGFQIDQLLAEGKVDEVYKKMEATLKQQFGGKVTTLKEGSESQAGAAQLQKEVAFLTQGPFGSLVKGSAEAYKLLESFKAGQSPTTPKTKEQLTEGLNKTIDTGRAIENNQYTEAQKIANNAEMAKIFNQQVVGQSGRNILHTDLKNEQTDSIQFRNKTGTDAKTQSLYLDTDVMSVMKDSYEKVKNTLSVTAAEASVAKNKENNINTVADTVVQPTPVEINAAKPNNNNNNNNNLTPKLPISPDNDAAQQRQNILRATPVSGTVLASTNTKSDQTLTIKVQSTGIDGKTEERVLAKARGQAIEIVETAKSDENSFATVGHN